MKSYPIGGARRYSDLDLAIRAKGPIGLDRLGELRAAFSESDLPMKVGVVDWAEIDDAFRAQISANLVLLYP
jgi:type I restriction enzyme S subunit